MNRSRPNLLVNERKRIGVLVISGLLIIRAGRRGKEPRENDQNNARELSQGQTARNGPVPLTRFFRPPSPPFAQHQPPCRTMEHLVPSLPTPDTPPIRPTP